MLDKLQDLQFHPHTKTDNPDDLIAWMEWIGAVVTWRYDVYEITPGDWHYMYIVDVWFAFPDNTVYHHETVGNNLLTTLQNAVFGLVNAIQYWLAENPGY